MGPLYRSAAELNLPHGFVIPPYPLIPLPTRPVSKHSGFKTHSSFLPIEEASFIAPYRNHRGHQSAQNSDDLSLCGRGASDTVLNIIGSYESTVARMDCPVSAIPFFDQDCVCIGYDDAYASITERASELHPRGAGIDGYGNLNTTVNRCNREPLVESVSPGSYRGSVGKAMGGVVKRK